MSPLKACRYLFISSFKDSVTLPGLQKGFGVKLTNYSAAASVHSLLKRKVLSKYQRTTEQC